HLFRRKPRRPVDKRRALIAWYLVIGAAIFTPLFYLVVGSDHPLVIKPFPDPFMFNNGTRVDSGSDWDARRAEIKDLLLETEYGTMPGHPDRINGTETSTIDLGGGRTLHVVALTVVPSNASPAVSFGFTAWLFVPAGAAPFPAVVKVGKDGDGFNQSAMDRGYLYACYDNHDLDPDTEGYDTDGPAQVAYPEHSWGSVAVWAWGAMRLADYLLGEPWIDIGTSYAPGIDPGILAITGHSRRGKTALLAGALDERFTIVVPNGSGCGGAGSFLVLGPACETIATMTSSTLYKAWFEDDFGRFAWNEAQLPFDQHFLRAMVAPRLMLSTDALDDFWANPVGTQAIYDASMPVFDFLNASARNGIHYRDGGHDQTLEDFGVLLDFADTMLRGIARQGEFYMRPFSFAAPVNYAAPA
ncbi:MAG: hypothetical protein JW839_16935, partial [Candidatus Lokiarchaeota archaeon]|nr:hypothetical protein [Candidatus Lokiarchaeota archaeon]